MVSIYRLTGCCRLTQLLWTFRYAWACLPFVSTVLSAVSEAIAMLFEATGLTPSTTLSACEEQSWYLSSSTSDALHRHWPVLMAFICQTFSQFDC